MVINPLWQEDFFLTVQAHSHQIEAVNVNPFYIIDLKTNNYIHLVPLVNEFSAEQLLLLQQEYHFANKQLVHLWEDVWYARRNQVLSRVKSFLRQNITVHGRKTNIVDINSIIAKPFLENSHLQGYVRCKTYLGLTFNNDLIAVAGFSGARPMNSKGSNYRSAELVRFASKDGLTITGGLSKLIKHFLTQVEVNDLMSYADRDWSIGSGYEKLGFKWIGNTEPNYLYVDTKTGERYFPHRLPKRVLQVFEQQNILNLNDFLLENGFLKVFNTGNLKYLLYTSMKKISC